MINKEQLFQKVKEAYEALQLNENLFTIEAAKEAEQEAIESGLFDYELSFIPENSRSMYTLITNDLERWKEYTEKEHDLNKIFLNNPTPENFLKLLSS